MDKNKVKIELYKSKGMAQFSHYIAGNLYYTVDLEDGKYQFPMSTTEQDDEITDYLDSNDYHDTDEEGNPVRIIVPQLSSDLGTTSFGSEMRGSELNRWIGKAIDGGEFIKVG